jgi:xanthine dehydrogenase accessory factor
MTQRQQPWVDDVAPQGRVLVLSDNPISRALASIATAAGREVVVEPDDDGGPGLAPGAGDAVVLCDHDAPDAPAVLRAALASEASYVAMMASRRRAAGLLDELVEEGVDVTRLHVPAGHDLGGKGPGEIALSVVAEIVAESHGRPGGPMRDVG